MDFSLSIWVHDMVEKQPKSWAKRKCQPRRWGIATFQAPNACWVVVWPWLNLLFQKQVTNGNSDCQTVETQREACRPKETCFLWGQVSYWLGGSNGTQGRPSPPRPPEVSKLEALHTEWKWKHPGACCPSWASLNLFEQPWAVNYGSMELTTQFISSNRQLLCQIWNHSERTIKIYDRVTGYLSLLLACLWVSTALSLCL